MSNLAQQVKNSSLRSRRSIAALRFAFSLGWPLASLEARADLRFYGLVYGVFYCVRPLIGAGVKMNKNLERKKANEVGK